jgi:glycosyltransferase involved in cell wall biosynthesis
MADRFQMRASEPPISWSEVVSPQPEEVSVATVSLAMPTRNRPQDVRRSVPTLLNTDAEAIIVVDQSSNDDTHDVLDEVGALTDPRIAYVRSNERGVSRARNLALRSFSTDIIAFTDDDCTVPTTWAADFRAIFTKGGYDVVFAPVAAPTNRGVIAGWIPEYLPLEAGRTRADGDPINSFGYTANVAISARTVETIGLFDEWLGPGSEHNLGGEDTDYGYRALRAGLCVGVETYPVVTHYGAKSGSAFDAARHTYQRGAAAFLDKHARLGDRAAQRREVQALLAPLREASANALRLRRPSGLGVVKSFITGIVSARRHYRVERTTKLYVPR